MTSLKSDPELWQRFVPIALHVDYWDYIGWRDRFASPAHADRQRAYAAQGGVQTVYTPGFVVDGMEWRGWFKRHTRPQSNNEVGQLIVSITDDHIDLDFAPLQAAHGYTAHVALLGTELSNEIGAGENSGRRLEHNFVVLASKTLSLAEMNGKFSGSLQRAALSSDHQGTALAAWVSKRGELTPVQATGGWLDLASR